MYFLNTTTRHSNSSATKQALELLASSNHESLSKFISLIKARHYEQQSSSYYKNNCAYNFDAYTTTTVKKQLHGYFSNKNDVPEEYRELGYLTNSTRWWNPFGEKEIWCLNTSKIIEENCKPSEIAKYQNEKLECGLNIIYNIENKINWDLILDDIKSGKLDLSTEEINTDSSYNQFASERFHPPPSMNDIITVERKAELSKLCILLGIAFPKNFDILNVLNLVCELEKKLFLQNPIYKVDVKRKHKNLVDKKHTFKAEYSVVATEQERLGLPKALRNAKSYAHTIKLIGLLKGRLHNMFLPATSASALVIDKTGLAMFGEPSKDPVTEALVILLMGSMSYQKLFTIESQMHGGIDRWLKAYLDLAIEERTTTIDFGRIFRIIPSPRILSLTPKDELEQLYDYILDWLKLFAIVFETQWALGVSNCVNRNMLVPRSGTTEINVNAWNACAGAWGSLTRYIRLIGPALNKEPVQLFKVLKLTAGDQMTWASSAGKLTEPDCEVFKNLTLDLKVLPWDGLFKFRDDFVSIIEQSCITYKVEPKKWLGNPIERSAETRSDVVSVCGVVVQPENVSILKEVGAFGSNTFGCNEN
jgi:hypothetical protein